MRDFFCLFYFPLKCDPLEKTPRKTEGYAYQDVMRRLLKWDLIFQATYSLPEIFDWHDQHAWCGGVGGEGEEVDKEDDGAHDDPGGDGGGVEGGGEGGDKEVGGAHDEKEIVEE